MTLNFGEVQIGKVRLVLCGSEETGERQYLELAGCAEDGCGIPRLIAEAFDGRFETAELNLLADGIEETLSPLNERRTMNVTLFKGGTKEITLPIDDVQIPDVWKIVGNLGLNYEDPRVDELIKCWHIAAHLKMELQEIAAATASN